MQSVFLPSKENELIMLISVCSIRIVVIVVCSIGILFTKHLKVNVNKQIFKEKQVTDMMSSVRTNAVCFFFP